MWVWNSPVPSQSHKPGEHNEEQNPEDTKNVEEANAPLGQCRVQQDDKCDAGDRDTM